MKRRKWLYVVLIFVLILTIVAIGIYLLYVFWSLASGRDWYNRHKAYIEKATRLLGHTEREVLTTLGRPHLIIYAEDVKKGLVEYPIPGYAYPERPITNKVLVYIKGDAIFYIYIDYNDFVEDVFYGPS